MQISSVNDVKIYNLSYGKSLPEVRNMTCSQRLLIIHKLAIKFSAYLETS